MSVFSEYKSFLCTDIQNLGVIMIDFPSKICFFSLCCKLNASFLQL